LNNRLNYIDYMKGIGILLVVLGHMSELPNSMRIFIYSFHMPLFFFISGYLFNANKNKEFKPFLKKKTFSLLLPYIYLQLFLFLFYSAADTYSGNGHNFAEHILTIIYGNILFETNYINTPWFLICLFTVDLMFQRITTLTKNNLRVIGLIALVSSLIGYSLSFFNIIRLPFTLDVTFTALAFYSAGYLFKQTGFVGKVESKLKKVSVTVLAFLLPNIIFLLLNNLWSPTSLLVDGRIDMIYLKYGNYLLFYIAALTGILFIYYLTTWLEGKNISVLNYLGQNSLTIMVFHIPVYVVIGKAFEMLGLSDNQLLLLLVKFILILLITGVIISIVNRYLPFTVGKKKSKRDNNSKIPA
jgi:acyltransferase